MKEQDVKDTVENNRLPADVDLATLFLYAL